jgi:uncharacterized membrane protein
MRAKLTITKAKHPTETRPTFGVIIASLMKGIVLGVIAGIVLGIVFGWMPLPWSAPSATGLTSIFAQNHIAQGSDED